MNNNWQYNIVYNTLKPYVRGKLNSPDLIKNEQTRTTAQKSWKTSENVSDDCEDHNGGEDSYSWDYHRQYANNTFKSFILRKVDESLRPFFNEKQTEYVVGNGREMCITDNGNYPACYNNGSGLVSGCQCYRNNSVIVGTIDHIKTCSILTTKGNILNNNDTIATKNWEPTGGFDICNANKGGYINCEYNFDFTHFTQVSIDIGNTNTKTPDVKDLIAFLPPPEIIKVTSSIPYGYSHLLKDIMNITYCIYACNKLIYDQIYMFDSYNTTNGNAINRFLKTNYFNNNDFNIWKTSVLLNINSSIINKYKFNTAILYSNIDSLLTLPKPIFENGVYYIEFNITEKQYNNNVDFGDYIRNFLSDVTNSSTKFPRIINDNKDVLITEADTLKFKYYDKKDAMLNVLMWKIKWENVLGDSNNSKINFFEIKTATIPLKDNVPAALDISKIDINNQYDNIFVCNYKVKLEITKWSPMLILYFTAMYSNIVYDIDTVNKFKSIVNGKFSLPLFQYMKPMIQTEKSTYIKNYCNIIYEMDTSRFNLSIASKYLLGNYPGATNICKCWNSKLAPYTYESGNISAMCFDKNCSSVDFHLLKNENKGSVCNKECNTVWGWTNSTELDNKSANPNTINWGEFSQRCDRDLKPYKDSKINVYMLIKLIFLSILINIFSFKLFINFQTQLKKHKISIIITSSILLIFSICLSIEMSGSGWCTGGSRYGGGTAGIKNEYICESKFLKLKIPDSYCNYKFRCECFSSEDCSNKGDFTCMGMTCLPKSGSRYIEEITKPDIMIFDLVLLLLSFLLFIIIFYKISNKSMGVILLFSFISFLFIIFIILSLTRKKKEKLFSSDKNILGCVSSEDCPSQYKCVNKKCTEIPCDETKDDLCPENTICKNKICSDCNCLQCDNNAICIKKCCNIIYNKAIKIYVYGQSLMLKSMPPIYGSDYVGITTISEQMIKSTSTTFFIESVNFTDRSTIIIKNNDIVYIKNMEEKYMCYRKDDYVYLDINPSEDVKLYFTVIIKTETKYPPLLAFSTVINGITRYLTIKNNIISMTFNKYFYYNIF